MRLTTAKVAIMRAKGYLPMLEWMRKVGATNDLRTRRMCEENLIPCVIVEGVFCFVPANACRPSISGGKRDRGKATGTEIKIMAESVEAAPFAEEIMPKKGRKK
jgi:hypothetical protein